MNPSAANLLLDHLGLLTDLERSLPVLDLACGTGRNGLLLAEQGISVVFADQSVAALNDVKKCMTEGDLPGHIWQVDLEQPGMEYFSRHCYGAIICFRYLHRPLFPMILSAVMPGGLVVYETFTLEQPRFGRPHNPAFLLRPGELKATFDGWEFIHHFEGIRQNPDRAVAQLVARKPLRKKGDESSL